MPNTLNLEVDGLQQKTTSGKKKKKESAATVGTACPHMLLGPTTKRDVKAKIKAIRLPEVHSM